ncbi:protein SGT1 homolog isoform X2 [Panulirus ornatus]|uniref:protein SGT1 homolog isoform X2 n=1 Tax=Panulirus ornatus TaxID=150431 RepID=UPI003A848DF7
MSVTPLQTEVSRLHADGQYLQAVELITCEIKGNPENPELFLFRAQNLLKLEKFKEASSDAARAIELGGSAEAHLVHGKALFNLGQYVESLDTFNKGKTKAGSEFGSFDQFGQWTAWCEERIKKLGLGDNTPSNSTEKATGRIMEKSEVPADTKPAPKVKHDWYQTETHVVITILIKNLKKEDVKVYFSEKAVSVTAPLPSGSDYSLAMDVCHPINPSESSFRVLPSKIEVKMKKVDGIRWATLQGDGAAPTVKANLTGVTMTEKVPSYPSSASKKHDWSKIEAEVKKEEEDEKLEGDAALNQLFQKIYGQGSDETRRAMNKSFMESGGTVLSTNWKDVANQKVEVKPPDGMEFKKWEQ